MEENIPMVLMAAWNDAGETMEYLLDSGAHIDTQNDNKRTPLHVASLKGHTMVVEHLLMCGANQKIEDKWGYTALDLAVIHDETREVLIDFMKKEKEELKRKLEEELEELKVKLPSRESQQETRGRVDSEEEEKEEAVAELKRKLEELKEQNEKDWEKIKEKQEEKAELKRKLEEELEELKVGRARVKRRKRS